MSELKDTQDEINSVAVWQNTTQQCKGMNDGQNIDESQNNWAE